MNSVRLPLRKITKSLYITIYRYTPTQDSYKAQSQSETELSLLPTRTLSITQATCDRFMALPSSGIQLSPDEQRPVNSVIRPHRMLVTAKYNRLVT